MSWNLRNTSATLCRNLWSGINFNTWKKIHEMFTAPQTTDWIRMYLSYCTTTFLISPNSSNWTWMVSSCRFSAIYPMLASISNNISNRDKRPTWTRRVEKAAFLVQRLESDWTIFQLFYSHFFSDVFYKTKVEQFCDDAKIPKNHIFIYETPKNIFLQL